MNNAAYLQSRVENDELTAGGNSVVTAVPLHEV